MADLKKHIEFLDCVRVIAIVGEQQCLVGSRSQVVTPIVQ
jgi:hypothetical protein